MCTQNNSLKMIALTCFFIMLVDMMVLYQTILQWGELEWEATEAVFNSCYKP